MSTPRAFEINIDGAARGNPGPAAFAFVITHDGEPVLEEAGRLGITTNNVAEYKALIRALERAATLGGDRLVVRSDSELLVKQMNGEYKVKNAALKELYDQAQALRAKFTALTLQHVRREQNRRADQLCNDALDGKVSDAPPPEPRGANTVRDEVLAVLRGAAELWARGNPADPDPEAVCDRLYELMKKQGRRPRG
jgi:ribonuclease HI